MQPARSTVTAVLALSIAAALPSTAMADRKSAERDGGIPSRLASSLKKTEKALDRAKDQADAGKGRRAGASFAIVRSNLNAATTVAKRRTASGNAVGVASAEALAETLHAVVAGTLESLDGAGPTAADGASKTLAAAIADRDELVAVIAKLSDSDDDDFADLLAEIDGNVDDEVEQMDGLLADGQLTDGVSAAIERGQMRLGAIAEDVAAQDEAGHAGAQADTHGYEPAAPVGDARGTDAGKYAGKGRGGRGGER